MGPCLFFVLAGKDDPLFLFLFCRSVLRQIWDFGQKGPSKVLTPKGRGALSPKFAQNRGFFLKKCLKTA